MQFTTLLVTLAAAVTVSAGPIVPRQASGHATYYNTYYPTFSSCGDQPQDTDMIAALAPSFMPGACGKTIAVKNENTGNTINVKVVDTCMACAAGSVAVDLTPTAFEALGATLADGTVAASWTFV